MSDGLPKTDLAAQVRACPFHRLLDVRLEEETADRVVIGVNIRHDLRRSDDGKDIHGGVIASLLDIAAAYAVAKVHTGRSATISLAVDYFRPVIGDSVTAHAKVLRSGRTLAWVETQLLDGDRVAAAGRVSFALRED